MNNRSIVLYASRWVLDDGTSGSTLHVLSDRVERGDSRGQPVAKITGSASVYSELRELPGLYDLSLGMSVRDGRGALSVEHAAIVEPLDLVAFAEDASSS